MRDQLPDTWKKFRSMRDSSPSLVDTPAREAAITRARFLKAQKMCDSLAVLPITGWPTDPADFTDEHWEAIEVVAGIANTSPTTRILVVELMADRTKQRTQ